MGTMKQIIDSCYELLSINMNIFGYNVSLWNVFMFSAVAGIVLWVLYRLFK